MPSVTGALATAHACGLPLADAVQAVGHVPPFKGRMQPVPLPNGATILRDEFNGSFDTMVRAIEVLQRATARRRVAVISDCSDLKKKPRERLKYLAKAMHQAAEVVVFVGERSSYGAQCAVRAGMPPENVHHFLSLQDAEDFLRGELKAGDLVLLKRRNSDHLSRICFALLGTVECRKLHCSLRMICDECPQLGARARSTVTAR